MNNPLRDRRSRILAVFAACLLACAAAYSGIRSLHDQLEVKKMTETMKTVCFGRFLVEVPADATISWRGAFIDGWSINSWEDETESQFDERLGKNQSELAMAKNERGRVSLEATTEVAEKAVRGKVFIYGRVGDDVNGRGIFRLHHLSLDFIRQFVYTEDVPILAKLVTQFTPLREGEIPTLPGFCFGPAMIGEPLTAKQSERVTMFIGIKDHPDISIVFDTIVGVKQGESLLVRAGRIKEKYADATTELRSGPRTIGNLVGEELLERVRENNGVEGHDFNWESVTQPDDVFHPKLSVELGSGYGRPGQSLDSSLSDTAIIALWDKLTSSLRVRPTTTPPPAAAPPTPAGAVIDARQLCPATGWWLCGDAGDGAAVQSGSTQYFRAGQSMPQAQLLGPASWWQQMRRRQPTFELAAATRWTFVGGRQPVSSETGQGHAPTEPPKEA